MRTVWWGWTRKKKPKTATAILAEVKAQALEEAAKGITVVVDPAVVAQLEELSLRLDGTKMQSLGTAITVLLTITEGGNREFTVTRFGRPLTFAIKEMIDDSAER